MADKKTSAKQETPEQPTPKAGEQWMVKHPSIGGTWQICQIIPHPTNEGGILVEFPDGTRYEPSTLQIGAQMAQPAAEAPATPNQSMTAPPTPGMINESARVSPLNPDYEAFRKVITELNAQSKRMFQLPLAVLLTMVARLATDQETPGAGHMGNYGGIQVFVPDQVTFDNWMEDYLLEIQKREAGNSPE